MEKKRKKRKEKKKCTQNSGEGKSVNTNHVPRGASFLLCGENPHHHASSTLPLGKLRVYFG
jgi:hypothetical protein